MYLSVEDGWKGGFSLAVQFPAGVGGVGEDGEGDGEELVVHKARVNGEDGHEEDHVSALQTPSP